MPKEISIILNPEVAATEELYKAAIAKQNNFKFNEISEIEVLKRSIDARKKPVRVVLRANVWFKTENFQRHTFELKLQNVSTKPEVIIVGAGPAGLFAALRLIERGFRPVIIERGEKVSQRKKSIAQINRNNELKTESNYCFGEGGAGTFSDGKLYTRSKKRGNTKYILDVLKFHGADEKILTEAHPHIGTNKLPNIIVNIRKSIISAGGKIFFNTKVTDFIIKDNTIKGVTTDDGQKFEGVSVILSTGHSARDIYYILEKNNFLLEAKSFAMGVRIEHSQQFIDELQYKMSNRGKFLPPAEYKLATQVQNRGVYSFCMCPGGFIVPSATNANETVVNGMSPSMRNSSFANSGLVVEIKVEDFPKKAENGVLAGLKFQEYLEKLAFEKGGENLIAPAQTIADFVAKRTSNKLPETSYNPGIVSSDINKWLPKSISQRLIDGLKQFDKKMKGFISKEAILLGVESRTSSPVRIPRDNETLEHVQIKKLYPCGEGAGYAGGIVSSAIDGIRCAEMITI